MKAVARRAESLFSIFLGGGVEHEFFVLETEWLNLPVSIRGFLEPYKWLGYIRLIDEEEVPATIIFEYKQKYSRGLTADDTIVLYYCIVNEMGLLSADPLFDGHCKPDERATSPGERSGTSRRTCGGWQPGRLLVKRI
jgi:hypothetical protein